MQLTLRSNITKRVWQRPCWQWFTPGTDIGLFCLTPLLQAHGVAAHTQHRGGADGAYGQAAAGAGAAADARSPHMFCCCETSCSLLVSCSWHHVRLLLAAATIYPAMSSWKAVGFSSACEAQHLCCLAAGDAAGAAAVAGDGSRDPHA